MAAMRLKEVPRCVCLGLREGQEVPKLILSEYQAPENERKEQLPGSKVGACQRGDLQDWC